MCSEICPPRMSLSSDLVHTVSPLQTIDSSDFEFNVCTTFDYQSSSADELFADGKILPTDPVFRHKPLPFSDHRHPTTSPLPPPPPPSIPVLESEVKSGSNTKSFWGFKRSMSLNSNKKSSFLSSLPPLLSRSNSTGSVPTQKRTTLSKHPSIRISKSSSLPSSSSSSGWNQKPPLGKKSHGGGGGYRVSPVLNVPSPANLFGFGSLFCNNNGKDKKKIRR